MNSLLLAGLILCGLSLVSSQAAKIEKVKTKDQKKTDEGFKPFTSRRGQSKDGTEKWAYVDVRPMAHKFWWLYRSTSEDGYLNVPIIIWLQGGPGASSCGYGNFELIGPLNLDLQPRNTTWQQQANVLFIDNPVGAGYSYVDQDSAYTRTTDEISEDLLTLWIEFLVDNLEFRTIPLFIFGQSYGGKMGAAFAKRLYEAINHPVAPLQTNLAGFAMGNAWISPIDSTLSWGPLLYWMSIVDDVGRDAIVEAAQFCKAAADAGEWDTATDRWRLTQNVVGQHSNYVDFYNILKFRIFDFEEEKARKQMREKKSLRIKEDLYDVVLAPTEEFNLDDLMNGPIREKLQIIPANVTWGAQSDDVFFFQEGDFMKDVISIVDEMLSTNMTVVVYQGQLDLICATVGAMDFVNKFTWSGMESYHQAERYPLTDPWSRQTETFVKAFRNFKFYWVQLAEHGVPKITGNSAYRMLERILSDADV